MVVIIRKKAGTREVVEKKQPKVKPRTGKGKPLSYYRKVFPEVNQGLLLKTLKTSPEALDTAVRCLKDTKSCHTNYFFWFVRAVAKLDRDEILALPKEKRWEFICHQK